MAFPDYGPFPDIAQMTQDGFSQGSFLFRMFAGEIDGSLALHYVGLTFALIGAVAIVFLKQFHNVKTILSWSFIMLVLLIGPRGGTIDTNGKRNGSSSFFTNIPVNNNLNPGGYTYVDAFTPQAVAIDFMSKIHKAIYIGFFDSSNPSKPRMRNIIEDISVPQSRNTGITLRERPDIKLEISMYNTFCGSPNKLPYPLYNKAWEAKVENINSKLQSKDLPAETRIPTHQLSKERTLSLQSNIFHISRLKDAFDLYNKAYKKQQETIYPPFAIAYQDIDDLEAVLTDSGVENEFKLRMLDYFDDENADNLAEAESDYFDFLTTKERLINAVGGSGNLTAINSTPNMGTPAFSAYITDNEALENRSIGLWKFSVNDADPIEKRLKSKSGTTDIIATPADKWGKDGFFTNEKWYDQVENGNLAHTPISLGFITPPHQKLYKSRESEHADRITHLTDQPVLNVVSNCAQLHTLVHNHIKEAIIFQNAWPAHGNDVNLAKPGGFDPLASGSDNSYLRYPYEASDNLSASQESINSMVQTQAVAYNFFDPSDGNKYKSLLNSVTGMSAADRKNAAESLRRAVNSNFISTALTRSNVYLEGYSAEGRTQRNNREALTNPNDDVSEGMRQQAAGVNLQENIDNVVSGPLQKFTEWVANIMTKVGAQFAGIGAIAFIRFLQLFIAIAIFFILMCTPILYMMGLIIPAHAPGVIVTSILTIIALKAIPIGFTLVDAVMSNAMFGVSMAGTITATDKSLMLYVAAAAYTSITMITFFLLFKAGDTQAVISQVANLDKKANEIADTAGTVVKGLAGAAAVAVTAGAGGAAGGLIKGKSLGAAARTGITQGGEVFGKRGAAAIPGAGNMAYEVGTSYREGKGQGQIIKEIESNNKDIDKSVAKLDSQLKFAEPGSEQANELQKKKDDLLSQRKSYGQHMSGYADAQAEEKYRSRVRGAQDHWAAGRAEDKFEKSAKSQGMTTQEARRNERDAKAEGAVNSTLGAAVQAQNLEMKGDVKLEGVEMSANAARAIQMGQLQADRSYKQANSDASETQRLAAVQDELKQQVKSTLATEVEGKGAKEVKSSVTYYETDDDGNVISSRVIPQDAMYDQAAGDLKKTLEGSAEFNASSPATRKNATELVAAKQLAEHSKGKYTDSDGNVKDFKLKLQPNVAEALHKTGDLDRIASSRNAKDLWIDPGSTAYDELRNLKGSDGKSMFNVPDGHSISLFNHHIQNDERAKQSAKDIMSDTNKQINSIKRNS